MKYYLLDVFAENKYTGNPLAVFLCEDDLSSEEMQKIAFEMHFSEVSFVYPHKYGDDGFNIRVFTPDTELPFAGHPSLGTAYIISRIYGGSIVKLNLPIGRVVLQIDNDHVSMQQTTFSLGKIISSQDAATFLNLREKDVNIRFPVQIISTGLPSLAIPLYGIAGLRNCRINENKYSNFILNYGRINLLPFTWYDNAIHVRCFMDDPGYLEDPATGSANSALGGYLLHYAFFGQRNEINYNAVQGYEMGRESRMRISAKYENEKVKTCVTGKIIQNACGEWN